MALVRWKDAGLSPWSALRELESALFRGNEAESNDLFGQQWAPAADIKETPEAFQLEVDLPGLKKDEIELSVVDNIVCIKGERRMETKEEKDGYHRTERHYGSFQRSFEIGGGFNPEKVEAKYENGVLRLMLPKREEAKPKQIDVKVQ